MNLSEDQIEAVLRAAPSPRPPADLPARLAPAMTAAGRTPSDGRPATDPTGRSNSPTWWRWLLLPGLATAAMAVALVQQQSELREVKRDLVDARARLIQAHEPAGDRLPAASTAEDESRADLARLRALVAELQREVQGLEGQRAEIQRLKAAIAKASEQLPPEQRQMMDAQERAKSIRCVNNLKQLGLSVRIWASDHQDEFPPNILSMTNEMDSPKILVCPADEGRQPARDWASFSAAHLSYEFLSPGPGKFDDQPLRVLFRCPFHGNVGLCDGSVQMGLAKSHPEWFETRDGGVYLNAEGNRSLMPAAAPGASVPAPAPQTGTPVQMSPELRQRYGLGGTGQGDALTVIPLPLMIQGDRVPANLGPPMELVEAARNGLRAVLKVLPDGTTTVIGTVPKEGDGL